MPSLNKPPDEAEAEAPTIDGTIVNVRKAGGTLVLDVVDGERQSSEVVVSPLQFREHLASEKERKAFDEWWGPLETC